MDYEGECLECEESVELEAEVFQLALVSINGLSKCLVINEKETDIDEKETFFIRKCEAYVTQVETLDDDNNVIQITELPKCITCESGYLPSELNSICRQTVCAKVQNRVCVECENSELNQFFLYEGDGLKPFPECINKQTFPHCKYLESLQNCAECMDGHVIQYGTKKDFRDGVTDVDALVCVEEEPHEIENCERMKSDNFEQGEFFIDFTEADNQTAYKDQTVCLECREHYEFTDALQIDCQLEHCETYQVTPYEGVDHYCQACGPGYSFTLNRLYCVENSVLGELNCSQLHDFGELDG
jgi:hypothetical protein